MVMDSSFFAVTMIPDIFFPVTVTRRIAESPPTFTVWQTSGPSPTGYGVVENPGRISSPPPSPAPGDTERVGPVEGVGSGVGVGEGGVGDRVGWVPEGVGEIVGSVGVALAWELE